MKRDTKEEDGDPSCSVGQKDQPTPARWTTVPRTMFNGWPEVSFCHQELAPLRVAKAQEFRLDGRIKIMDWTEKQIKECHEARMEGRLVLHQKYHPIVMALKGNLTLPKVHGISHQKASVPDVSQGDHN